jgi:D-aminopeptidase
VQGLFDDIISGFPEGQEIDPVRLKFEEVRRLMTAEAKAAIKND